MNANTAAIGYVPKTRVVSTAKPEYCYLIQEQAADGVRRRQPDFEPTSSFEEAQRHLEILAAWREKKGETVRFSAGNDAFVAERDGKYARSYAIVEVK